MVAKVEDPVDIAIKPDVKIPSTEIKDTPVMVAKVEDPVDIAIESDDSKDVKIPTTEVKDTPIAAAKVEDPFGKDNKSEDCKDLKIPSTEVKDTPVMAAKAEDPVDIAFKSDDVKIPSIKIKDSSVVNKSSQMDGQNDRETFENEVDKSNNIVVETSIEGKSPEENNLISSDKTKASKVIPNISSIKKVKKSNLGYIPNHSYSYLIANLARLNTYDSNKIVLEPIRQTITKTKPTKEPSKNKSNGLKKVNNDANIPRRDYMNESCKNHISPQNSQYVGSVSKNVEPVCVSAQRSNLNPSEVGVTKGSNSSLKNMKGVSPKKIVSKLPSAQSAARIRVNKFAPVEVWNK
jgi:hypothetical protein